MKNDMLLFCPNCGNETVEFSPFPITRRCIACNSVWAITQKPNPHPKFDVIFNKKRNFAEIRTDDGQCFNLFFDGKNEWASIRLKNRRYYDVHFLIEDDIADNEPTISIYPIDEENNTRTDIDVAVSLVVISGGKKSVWEMENGRIAFPSGTTPEEELESVWQEFEDGHLDESFEDRITGGE